VNLFKLLSLDISPCLQKAIILIFINYFSSHKITEDNKKSMLTQLIVHNFFDIILYMYSIALIDVRCECIRLFREINAFKDTLAKSKIYEERFLPYIREYLLPDDIMCFRHADIRERGVCLHKGFGKLITIGGSDKKLNYEGGFETVNPFTSKIAVYIYLP
jgi:hypothetical protein